MSILNREKILEQARLFVEEGKYDKAIKEYEKILLADPSDMRVKLRVAELHVKRKQVGDAIRVYRDVAAAYTGEGFYLKAVTVYKNILRLNPSMIEINEQLAELYEKMGLISDAVRQYDIFASALEHKGDIRRLMDIRKKIVELAPDDGSARVKLAELFQRQGRGEEAIDQYEEYARRLKEKGGDESRLVEIYEKILSHRTGREEMLRGLVRIYYQKGEIKKALKWLEYAKTLTPIDPELLNMQAEIYARLNQVETARSKYLNLSELHREHGDIDEAVKALARIAILIPGEEERVEKRAQEIGPDALPVFREFVAKLRAEEKKKAEEEITEVAEEAKEEKPPEVAPPSAPLKGKPKEAEWEKTVIVAQQADPRKVKEAKSAYDLALLYRKIGLEDESKKELEKAARLYEDLARFSAEATARHAEILVMLGRKAPRVKKPQKKPAPKPKKRKISFV